MTKPRKFSAAAKLVGKFKSGTCCSFNIKICERQAISLAEPFVKSFRTVMPELYPEPATPPALRKITITISLP